MARERPDVRVWLTRNLLILTLVSLFQDAASELLYPLLPVLLTGVLAAPPVVLAARAARGARRPLRPAHSPRCQPRASRAPFFRAALTRQRAFLHRAQPPL